MREQLEKRLQALTTEYEAGQKALANLEIQKASLRETLLRISGAIQVLEEELAIAKSQNNHKVNEIDFSTIEVISLT
ncbi:hypothetical protein H6G54_26865 [Anabaena cylindrica FACHB-243]|uniref:Uncharacterized protein n=1 Tax=Anabaena cylindrica (strain ATCC 27899 / PCC 7122) TaxID=272123 RepID=K9ZBS3_ANACC|nr:MULTISPECIES: hypothetical protein [Anabaena]AFZ55815.1 hypothetical protein Anacy_0208 [Anabaena cylindrica PCC 7122]MBD2421238.1 hypothetical protein [Anabaena cylindrica FACHB-243]MBY5284147.1 hypothetical protein [Anabaena sp. CCAP 1446/1C]MBY5308069.1 hypothetical protein [Anabaena sp. CCAP 1446/1C]MCM2406569.1 hypothetical protein [Anabaena sp. CCAP 1446/1C]